MTDAEKINLIESCIMDDYGFSRMATLHGSKHNTYDDFMRWNMEAVDNLSEEAYNHLYYTCVLIKRSKLTLMDQESCISFTADSFYFDENKNVCITNPR